MHFWVQLESRFKRSTLRVSRATQESTESPNPRSKTSGNPHRKFRNPNGLRSQNSKLNNDLFFSLSLFLSRSLTYSEDSQPRWALSESHSRSCLFLEHLGQGLRALCRPLESAGAHGEVAGHAVLVLGVQETSVCAHVQHAPFPQTLKPVYAVCFIETQSNTSRKPHRA